ncbi:hypothetical protein [Clavibacter zhangzhiyongii]|uniref:hypothetical protein n=1 Tax=Clavibacter zhangzhiyongii TaxID=2768071 RepID=UPI0039E03003
MIQWPQVIQFIQTTRKLGIEPPRPLVRGLELKRLAEPLIVPKARTLLDAEDGDLQEIVLDLAIHNHSGRSEEIAFSGMGAGVHAFTTALLSEVHQATVPLLEDVVAQLRPGFDEATAPFVVAAQDYQFTSQTTADAVLNMADEKASAAMRATRVAEAAVRPYVAFRQFISQVFEVSPTPRERDQFGRTGLRGLDWSVCFAAGDNWSTDGAYYEDGHTDHHLDWLGLAKGGLRLNTPAEVSEKLDARARTIPRPAYAEPAFANPTFPDTFKLGL